MIPLLEALNRILTSTATNEGPDARCVAVPVAEGVEPAPLPVAQLRETLEMARDQHRVLLAGVEFKPTMPVRIERKLRNWKIVDVETGLDLLKQHPWDSTPNVADVRATRGSDPAHIESLIEFSNKVQSLANEAERLQQFIIAMNLWQMVSVINDFTKQPVANAINEATRLAGVVAALTGQPVQTAQQVQKPSA